MDKESKVTYGVIAVLIILLLGIAYMLVPSTDTPNARTDTYSTSTPTGNEQASTNKPTPTATTTMNDTKYTTAVITTNKGTIEIELLSSAPNTAKNFATLAESKFYDGVKFHRVIKNFMIQTGDPLSKDESKRSMWGTGGPGYRFADELSGSEQYSLGTVAMANAGPNTNGSQFFIVTANPGYPLPPSYTVFGKVTKGIETALAIQEVATNQSDQPLQDVVIEKIEVK